MGLIPTLIGKRVVPRWRLDLIVDKSAYGAGEMARSELKNDIFIYTVLRKINYRWLFLPF